MLLTKLHIPPASPGIVHRPELYEKLKIGLSRKLILISAPAGFGKTTVMSDWINQNIIPAAWFSIDNGDNDPVEFLNYIIAGIQSIQPTFGQGTLKLLNSPNKPSGESIANLLINEILNIDQNFILVLDDFHLINNTEVLNLVTYLLEHVPVNIHIVILTRSDPAISVSRLRSQNQLVELRSSDLSFSANDISILFNKKLKLGLSIEDVISLEAKTEGWIAGLQLTALSMQGREDISGYIQDFKGDNRYIMDYLMEEVLKIQSDDIKEFLLQTSVLEQMSSSLCNSVLNRNDSQLILETLEKNNMFVISLDDERKWFRYHHLFADLLKQRLQLQNKEAVTELRDKACDWFEQNNMFDFAIGHSLAIQNHEKSIQLIGCVVEKMWENGHHAAILKYGNLLPEELIQKNASFSLYFSWILIISGQIKKAEPFLLSAESITKNIIDNKNSSDQEIRYNKKLLGKISVAFAYLYSITADAEKAFHYGKTAMENLTEDDPLWFSWGWFSIGIAETVRGHIKESIEAYGKALAYGKKSGNIYLISSIAMNLAYLEVRMGLYTSSYTRCSDLITFMKERGYSQITKSEASYAGLYSCMAGIECMRTDFEEALKNVKIAYNLSKNDSNNSYKVIVLMVYWLILTGRGDKAGSEKMLNETENIIKLYKVAPAAMAIFVASKGKTLIEQAQLEQAHEIFAENGISLDNNISPTFNFSYFSYAYLLITESRFVEAEKLLSKLLTATLTTGRTEDLIVIKTLFTILYNESGNREKAIINLIESMEYATSEQILMQYLYYHSRIGELIREVFKIQAAGKTNIPNKLIEKLKFAIEKREKNKEINISEGISSRELDTLKLIAEELSNREIADKLFISLNTVKSHIKNIFLKLEVDSRIQAVIKAKELGII
jgi:LuxR family transcriptional regulator, maltose regulon positive regulatory protein